MKMNAVGKLEIGKEEFLATGEKRSQYPHGRWGGGGGEIP